MSSFFARRTGWNLIPNAYSEALAAHRRAGRKLLDLTVSNPTIVGLHYSYAELLSSLVHREALTYEPQPKGLLIAREPIAHYYAEKGSDLTPEDLILTTSTSEGYSYVFRLLCNPGDAVLVCIPSYPLFEFLGDLQDVKLVPYELVYDHGWQIDFHSLQSAIDGAHRAGTQCRAVLVVHPNNPTGSYVKRHEVEELNRICNATGLAIVADEVFLDYGLTAAPSITFTSNTNVLTFTLSGLSKISALPQMKVAWVATSGPAALKADALSRLEVIADTYLSMNTPMQWAIPAMLDQRHDIQRQLLTRIRGNLEELDSQLARQSLCRRLDVEGGWYAVVRVPVMATDEEFAIALLRQIGVVVHPGHFYGFVADGYIVMSLITPREEFSEGITRLLTFVAGT